MTKTETRDKTAATRPRNPRRRRAGIFLRTFLLSFLLSSTIIAIFALVTIPRQRAAIIRSIESQARSVSASIAQVCGNAIVNEDYGFIVEHNMEVVHGSPDILYVIVARRDGFCLIHTADGWAQQKRPRPEWVTGARKTATWQIDYSGLVDQDVFHYCFPVDYSGLQWGWLHVGLSLDHLNREIRSTYRRMLVLSLSCLAMGMLLSYVFARRLTQPILSLAEVTRRIAHGDLSARADIATRDEIEDLATSFNRMTDNLQRTTVSRDYVDGIIKSMTECLIVATPERRIQTVNKATLDLLGYTNGDLIGCPIGTLFDEDGENEEMALQQASGMAELMKRGSVGNVEKTFLSKDGRRIPVLFSASVMRGENSRIEGIVCTVLDIAERKEAEDALASEREQLLSIFDSINEVVYVADPATYEIVYVNRALKDILGKDPTGEICYRVFQGRDKPCDFCTNDIIAKRQGAAYQWEHHNPIFNRDYMVFDRMIKWPDGRDVRFELAIDVTERKQLENQLRRAQRMDSVGTLASGVAHNFNNILGIILGNAELLKMTVGEGHESSEFAAKIVDATDRAARLAQQLLSVARQESGVRAHVRVSLLLEGVVQAMRDMLDSNIQVHLHVADDRLEIVGNQVDLEQVLMNICLNARDAMPKGGSITIQAKAVALSSEFCEVNENMSPGRYVCIAIKDTGTGMDMRTLTRIFDPFFTTKGPDKGVGLGLATAYGTIVGHGGCIDVESQIGTGTAFRIYLPVAPAVDAGEAPADSPALREGTETVLVVDDEASITEMTRRSLEMLGYTVHTAANGQEAVECYRRHRRSIDVVLLDYMMPVMDGEDAYHALKEIDPNVCVIIASGYDGDGKIRPLLKAGANGFVHKPYRLPQLSDVLRDVLDGE